MRVHLNGSLIPDHEATVSIFDRGFLFGDGVYEGLRTSRGVVIGLDRHITRMRCGLAEARIRGFDAAALADLTSELIGANNLADAFVYWQITRGTPPGAEGPARSRMNKGPLNPTVLGFAIPVPAISECKVPELRRVAIRPDTRWTRCHLKSISLLGGVLAAIEADELGADDAILVRDGRVTEGTATNVFACIEGRVVTPALESASMLSGVTRALILGADPSIQQRTVTIDELRSAEEIMLVGTKTMVAGVSTLDGVPVGSCAEAPGPRTQKMLDLLTTTMAREVDRTLGTSRPAAGELGAMRV